MKRWKRKLGLLLAALMVASAAAGCSETKENGDEGQAVPSGQEAVSAETEPEPEETQESFDPGLPEKDFGGRRFIC